MILIALALLMATAVLFGIVTTTNFFVRPAPVAEDGLQTSVSAVDIEEALGVVRRITEPSTGRITGYDVRGVVLGTDTNDNILTLSVSDNENEALLVSLGDNANIIGFLDKRSESSERDGLIEKNTYTSDAAGSIFEQVVAGQTVLVHIPVWVDTPDPTRCDNGCVERVEAIQGRGELYTPLLEDIIYTSVVETDTVFIVSILEIEN